MYIHTHAHTHDNTELKMIINWTLKGYKSKHCILKNLNYLLINFYIEYIEIYLYIGLSHILLLISTAYF